MAYKLEGDEQERKLFVGGLNKTSTDEEQLKQHFENYGEIIDCNIMRDQEKRSRGFGFILFEDATSVDKIIAAKKDGTEFSIDDHRIEIKRALPKVPRGNDAVRHNIDRLYRKIFVGGLPSTANEDDLRNYFERYGRVNEIELLRDRDTGRLRGFAFVTFDDEDSADKCLQRRTHEICQKVCEVKRAQSRSALNKEDDRIGSKVISGHSTRTITSVPSDGRLSMEEVNRLIQQAFAMGQSLYHQPGLQAPTAASLLNGTAQLPTQSSNNVLLQALLGQHVAPAAPPAPVVPAAPAAPANSGLNQLAQILQSGGIDANALVSLLNKEPDATKTVEPTKPPNAAYPTAYPYNYNAQSSNYGPSKDDESKRGYRPY